MTLMVPCSLHIIRRFQSFLRYFRPIVCRVIRNWCRHSCLLLLLSCEREAEKTRYVTLRREATKNHNTTWKNIALGSAYRMFQEVP